MIEDPEKIAQEYFIKRWTTFVGITVGYSFFYFSRLTLSVAKKPMVEAGLVTVEQLGQIGFALYLFYAFGRLTNGFLCDRAHIGRFMGFGLLSSAVLNLIFGFSNTFWTFLVLWAFNGWVQSMGSAPSGSNLAAWFSRSERGARYSIWSLAHNIGEGLTFILTALFVATWGWRGAFLGPGIICALMGLIAFRVILDRPRTYGLPDISIYKKEEPHPTDQADVSVGQHQTMMLKNPGIWILGLACACLYVSRYGINSWYVFYLQEAKGYSVEKAGLILSFSPIIGIAGTVAAGPISDIFFKGRRIIVALIYGLLLVLGLCAIPLVPAGQTMIEIVVISVCGFAIGGLLVFLGGLIAIDISSKRAAGAAMGVIGLFSYLAAAVQDWVSGWLIESDKMVVGGETVYDFSGMIALWVGSAILSLILTASVSRFGRHVR